MNQHQTFAPRSAHEEIELLKQMVRVSLSMGLTYGQIAEDMSCSINTIKQFVHRESGKYRITKFSNELKLYFLSDYFNNKYSIYISKSENFRSLINELEFNKVNLRGGSFDEVFDIKDSDDGDGIFDGIDELCLIRQSVDEEKLVKLYCKISSGERRVDLYYEDHLGRSRASKGCVRTYGSNIYFALKIENNSGIEMVCFQKPQFNARFPCAGIMMTVTSNWMPVSSFVIIDRAAKEDRLPRHINVDEFRLDEPDRFRYFEANKKCKTITPLLF
ncbi:hypothetical protein [Oricola sp.]|uniref:hypothetical protein n=1 Tax=Oricola sp. TaxID=1979950 RepID=UPI0035124C81